MNEKITEHIYKKLSQLEHILVRPDTYVGSIEKESKFIWIFDNHTKKMVKREICFVPALYKIFDEILVNAADNKQRDNETNYIDIQISKNKGFISIENDGKGIPIMMHNIHNMYIPELIFGNLLTSSNFNDVEKKTTGGRNGYGAKLANIFSKKFLIETHDSEKKKIYKQVWRYNMRKKDEPIIKEVKNCRDKTKITFFPDFKRFKMKGLEQGILQLLSKRAYDLAGSTNLALKVKLNGKRIPIKNFKEYCNLYLHDGMKVAHQIVSDRWEVLCACLENGTNLEQISHVNSIWTIKGGTHVKIIADQIGIKITEFLKRKMKGLKTTKKHIQHHMFLFINCLIENPIFGSQTKENLILNEKKFGSKPELKDKFLKDVCKIGIIESVGNWLQHKQSKELKKQDGKKVQKLIGIAKLDDANDAGSKYSSNCTLILTEGDSAKALAVSGLSVIGRDRYGIFPLKGKLLNVRDAPLNQVAKNTEIESICKIVGLKKNTDYSDDKKFSGLRYGHIMVMADQDFDGSHIKGLVINFIHHYWPSLFRRPKFLTEFITPIVIGRKGDEKKTFYTIPEYENWKKHISTKGWFIKYYKGLGTSTAKEAKEYFKDLDRHQINFTYQGPIDDDAISLVFSKKRVEDRKAWLESSKIDVYLDQNVKQINYSEFM